MKHSDNVHIGDIDVLLEGNYFKSTALIQFPTNDMHPLEIALPLTFARRGKILKALNECAVNTKGEQSSLEQLENILNNLTFNHRRLKWSKKDVIKEVNHNQHREPLRISSIKNDQSKATGLTWTDCKVRALPTELSFSRVIATVHNFLSEDPQTPYTFEELERLSLRHRIFFFDPKSRNGIGKLKLYFVSLPKQLIVIRNDVDRDDDLIDVAISSAISALETQKENNKSHISSFGLLACILLKLEQSQDTFWIRLKQKCEKIEKERITGPLDESSKKLFSELKESLVWIKRKLDSLETDLVMLEESATELGISIDIFGRVRSKINYRQKIYSACKDLLKSVDETNQRVEKDASSRLTDNYRRVALMFTPATLTESIVREGIFKDRLLWASAIWGAVYGLLWAYNSRIFHKGKVSKDEYEFTISTINSLTKR